MTDKLECWKCGDAIVDIPLPLARQAECPACRADLHVCRMCEYYDARLARNCREPVADDVSDKERANFCGYFQARPGAYRPRDDAAIEAQRQLDAIFGANLDHGLTNVPGNAQSPSQAEAAKEQLERLFGVSPKSGK